MPKMIQLRNVPDDLHRTLRIRATAAGQTLTDYLVAHIAELARRPTVEELRERLRRRARIRLSEPPVAVIRAERDNR